MVRRLLCALLALLLLTTVLIPAAFAEKVSAYIGWNTKVYQRASYSSASLNVSSGTHVAITGISGSWAQIKRDGITAYLPLKYLILKNRLAGHTNCSTTLYRSASLTSAKKGTLGTDTNVYIVNRSGSFYMVQNADASVYGYVVMDHVSPGKASAAATPAPQPEQARVKGYLNQSAHLYRTASSSSGKIGTLSVNTVVYILGQSGEYYRVENESGSICGYVAAGSVQSSPVEEPKVIVMDWYEGGSDVFRKHTYANIYDIESGVTIRFKRMGGTNHADIEPATAEDTAKLLEICGGEFSWDSRAVILYAGGLRIACAINTMPHGDQTILDNNYEGQCCLHMINSRTHGSDSVNTEHQKAIQKAYQWGNK